MDSQTKDLLASACQTMLRPIVKILLRCGMTYREFDSHAKAVFVDACGSEYGLRGRPANASRIAIMTGLSRREIQRQRQRPPRAADSSVESVDRASRVLAGWHDDARFSSSKGVPMLLKEEGPGRSFAELYANYGGDVPVTAMLKELKRSGAVEITKDGRLRALHRYYMPERTDTVHVQRAATVLADIGTTVYYNLNRRAKDPSNFEGRATNMSVPASAVPAFRDYLEEEGERFLDNADRWLGEHEQDRDKTSVLRLGVGAYFIIN